jgi:hypothetical protein
MWLSSILMQLQQVARVVVAHKNRRKVDEIVISFLM